MAYFPNGTSGQHYEDHVCSHCVHSDGCTIWFLHLMHNYDQIKDGKRDKGHFLQALIPDCEDGTPDLCTMFFNPNETVTQMVKDKFD